MKIDSPNLGSVEVESNKLIEFPLGLPGFEDCRKFTLIEIAGDTQAVALLQSADHPDVAFSVTTPEQLGLHYEFTLAEEEERLLGNPQAEDVLVLLIVRRDDSGAPRRRVGELPIKANLMSPLVVNAAAMLGLQKTIANLGCEVTLKAVG